MKKLLILSVLLVGTSNAQYRGTFNGVPDPRPVSMQPILGMDYGAIPQKEFNVPPVDDSLYIPAAVTKSVDGNTYTVDTVISKEVNGKTVTAVTSLVYDKFGNYLGTTGQINLNKKTSFCNIF